MLSTFVTLSVNSAKHLRFTCMERDSSVAEFTLSKAEGLLQNDNRGIYETASRKEV